MSEEAFSVTLWACLAYAAVTPAVEISNRCCPPSVYLDPTFCQISSTLHIYLSELEQVALNFKLHYCRHAAEIDRHRRHSAATRRRFDRHPAALRQQPCGASTATLRRFDRRLAALRPPLGGALAAIGGAALALTTGSLGLAVL